VKSLLAIIFHGPSGESAVEQLMSSARRSAAEDLIASLTDRGIPALLVTPESEAGRFHPSIDVSTTPDGSFHFGQSLQGLIRARSPQGLLVFGSGSGALLGPTDLEALAQFALKGQPGAVFNNFYSSDLAAIAEPEALLTIELPPSDNALGFALADAGLPCRTMRRNAETQFDIDTPTDLHVLKASERGGAKLQALLRDLEFPHPTLPAILQKMTERAALLMFIGRLSPRTWADIEGQIACRTHGLIEGRGMRSSGIAHSPLLSTLLREEGPGRFVRRLASSCDAAIVDSRPLLAENGLLPCPADRFSSDLFAPDSIQDPLWREFTEAAAEAPVPILLGGHSVLSGGLYLMGEACWKDRSLERRLHPDLFEPDKEPS